MESQGRALRDYRLAHNLTQIEMAGRLGVTQAMIAEIEAGTRQPGADLAKRIAKELDIEDKGHGKRGPYWAR